MKSTKRCKLAPPLAPNSIATITCTITITITIIITQVSARDFLRRYMAASSCTSRAPRHHRLWAKAAQAYRYIAAPLDAAAHIFPQGARRPPF